MAVSLKLYNYNNLTNYTFKNRYLRLSLKEYRLFCAKNGDAVTGSCSLEANSDKETQEKETKKTPVIRKSLRFKPTPVSDEMKEAAKQKLKSLLLDVKVTSDVPSKSISNLNLAKAVKRISKKERLQQIEDAKITPEKTLNMAVKAVASTFKEDSVKVESELTKKLSTLYMTKKDPVTENVEDKEMPQFDEKVDENVIDSKVNENLMSSVEEIAATISEQPIPPRSELIKRLMRLSLDEKIASDGTKSMRSVIEGMVIKKMEPAEPKEKKVALEGKKEKQFERRMSGVKPSPAKRMEHVNLFNAAPLNIFTPDSEMKLDSTNTHWQKLQERELRLLTQFAPTSAFEEMIMWTEQGKHWKLPIDNETEMGAEENVGFHEHVFLEKHLKGFPTRGPIRHFMELVCVGLSKNPYITVERKIDNIDWFRNYFKEKEDILKECGALD